MAEIEFDTQTQAATTTPAAGAVTLAFDSADNAPFIKTPAGGVQKFSTTTPLADRTAQTIYVATDYGITPANTGAANVTAFNTLFASLPLGAIVYFPNGTYNFASELTLNRDIRVKFLGAGRGRSILQTTSATANLFNITVAGFYISFEELSLASSVTKTAGAHIVTASAAGNNAYLDVRRCEFSGYFFGCDFQGAGPFNVGTMSECQFTSPSAGGTGIRINSQGTNAMLTNVTINQAPGASGTGICVDVVQSGALQFVGCDFIGGQTTLRMTPAAGQIVAAAQFTNCFFDQAGAVTVDIGGAGSVSRVKFSQGGITNGNVNNSIAIRVAGSGTGTAIPTGIDFTDVDVYNAFAATGTTGFLLTGFRDVSVTGCRIAGFAFGVDVTPYSANGISSFNLLENRIGPTENFAGNGTGVRINASAVQFAPSAIIANYLTGNTTAPLVQSGTFTNSSLQVNSNVGLPMQAQGSGTTVALPATTATTPSTLGAPVSIPANSLRAGQMYRITATVTNTATAQNTQLTLRYGVNGTNADAAVVTATATGTAAAGAAVIEAVLYVKSATSVMASISITQAAAAGFNNAASATTVTTAPVTIANTANSFLGLYAFAATANIVSVQSVHNEVVAQ